MSRLTLRALTAGAAAALLIAGPAVAQEQQGERQDGMTIFGRSLSVSLKAHVAPEYLGSDHYVFGPAGSFNLLKPGEEAPFAAPDDGVSLGVIGGERWSAGLSAGWRSSRDNDDELRGFDEVDWSVEAGAFAAVWPTEWLRLRADVRRGFNGHEGVVASLGADAVYRDDTWILSLGPRVRWTDNEFTQTYFGVTPLEAARSPFALPAYRPNDAVSSAGLVASAEYRLSPRWSVVADAQYQRLRGSAAASPIVRTLGSEDQFSGSLGLQYSFGR